VQYLAIRYTERLAEIGAGGSVGSVGGLLRQRRRESLIGLFKTGLIGAAAPGAGSTRSRWRPGMGRLFNNRRLHSAYGNVPPVEYERQH
jgi:putative transposase